MSEKKNKFDLKIIAPPNPLLKKKSNAITKVTPDLISFVGELQELMYKAGGVGIASPQVGVPARIFAMHLFDEPNGEPQSPTIDNGRSIIIVNPKIEKKEGKPFQSQEGCLSYPGLTLTTLRYPKIMITHCNLSDGEYVELELEGRNAVCAQHEMDHLDGVDHFDSLPRQKRRSYLAKQKKMKK